MKKAGQPQSKRDRDFWTVLNAALELDFKKGHLKWTMSELSRKSGITRSLIYYHFGRSKTAILEQAVQVIGEEVMGFDEKRIALWEKGSWVESTQLARAVIRQSPHLTNFYLLHRDRPTDVGKGLRSLESRYIAKLGTFFPQAGPVAQRALFTLFFGTIFSPFSDDEVISIIVAAVKDVLKTEELRIPVGQNPVGRG